MLIVTSQDNSAMAVVGAGSYMEIKPLGGASGQYWGLYINDTHMGDFVKPERAQNTVAQIEENLVLAALWLSKNRSKMLKKEADKTYAKAYLSYKIPQEGAYEATNKE